VSENTSQNRIQQKFDSLKSSQRKALIPYITPEYPFKGITVKLLRAVEEAGADLVEVGIPFSDPLADGETIQRSSEFALKQGVNVTQILESVREFRKLSQLPLLLMGYYNSILHFGIAAFCKSCQSAGVDGLIVPDMPPEESADLTSMSRRYGISNVFLIAPTTPDARIREIDQCSTHFSYCVSVTGVTGARTQLGGDGGLDQFLQRVKSNMTKPFVVGFGISRPEHVQRVWKYADGAVVGSSLINVLGSAPTENEALRSAIDFLRSLRST
jgi:tryptophan synthase alpha chain